MKQKIILTIIFFSLLSISFANAQTTVSSVKSIEPNGGGEEVVSIYTYEFSLIETVPDAPTSATIVTEADLLTITQP